MRYTIFFNDGGCIKHEGKIVSDTDVFRCYGNDFVIKFIIPVGSVKYIEISD